MRPFLGFLSILGFLASIYFYLPSLSAWRDSLSWTAVEGSIDASWKEERKRTVRGRKGHSRTVAYTAVVNRFAYVVDGQAHRSTRYGLWGRTDEWPAALPVGTRIPVFVDPTGRKEACHVRRFPWLHTVIAALGLLCSSLAIYFFLVFAKRHE